MRESNIDSKVELLIWSLNEDLHLWGVGVNDRYVLLLFLSLYRDGLLSLDFILNEYSSINNVSFLDNDVDLAFKLDYYPEIIEAFSPFLSKNREEIVTHLIKRFSEIDRVELDAHFPRIFDSLLSYVSQFQIRYGGEFILPKEISSFISSIKKLPSDAKIYNPFAGVASFGLDLKQEQTYYAQELNRQTWAIGMLRLMAYGRLSSSQFEQVDSIDLWNRQTQFDLVVAAPPLGLRINKHKYPDSEYRTIEQFLVAEGTQVLNNNGALIALLPTRFLFEQGKGQEIREFLVKNDLLDTVILLPSGLLMNTGVSLVVVVIEKKKKQPELVRFVDAKGYVSNVARKRKILNSVELVEDARRTEDSESVRIVKNTQIEANDYRLDVPLYFIEEIDGVKLNDLIDYIRPQRLEIPSSGKLIKVADLKDDKYDHQLSANDLDVSEMKKVGIRGQLSESALLLSMIGNSLKPTFFSYANGGVFLRNYVEAFRVNEQIIDKSYLINELQEDYVIKQIKSLRVGAGMRYIRRKDLLNIVIKLPTLAEQRAKVAGLQQLSKEINRLQEERNRLAHGAEKVQYDEFASLKHSMGAPRHNILSNAKTLIRFFERNTSEAFEQVALSFSAHYDIDLLDVFKQVRDDINHISVMLENGEKGLIMDNYSKESVSLKDINDLVKSLRSKWDVFSVDKHLIEDDKLSLKGIECNTTLLRILFDNILKNAQKYAFEDDSASNVVDIDMMVVEDTLRICIKNNGKPFPPKMTKKQFVSKFVSGNVKKGTGIGGYDINRIANYFGDNEWSLDLDAEDIFPVSFTFEFPIKSIS